MVLIVGLTGGIASGKSTVSSFLKEHGAYIIDADVIARDVVEPGKPAWEEIQAFFGQAILLPDGHLDRKKLGQIVFKNKDALHKLNDITHSRVKTEIAKAIEKAKLGGYNIVVLDVPLLIEAGWQQMADTVWVVYVDKNTQITRLMERDHISKAEAVDRILAQMSLDEKKKYADIIIDNSGSSEKTRKQVEDALSRLVKGAKTIY